MPPPSEDVAQKIIEEINEGSEVKKTINAVVYRPDYMDFLVLVNGRFHCEVREKLITDYLAFDKNPDVIREIRYLMEHALEYEDWELEEAGLKPKEGDEKSAVDDSDKYDFL